MAIGLAIYILAVVIGLVSADIIINADIDIQHKEPLHNKHSIIEDIKPIVDGFIFVIICEGLLFSILIIDENRKKTIKK